MKSGRRECVKHGQRTSNNREGYRTSVTQEHLERHSILVSTSVH